MAWFGPAATASQAKNNNGWFKSNIPKGALSLRMRHEIVKVFNDSPYIFGQQLLEASGGLKVEEIYSFNVDMWAAESLSPPMVSRLCLAEGRVCLSGEVYVLGVHVGLQKIDRVINDIKEADGAKLYEIAKQPGNLFVRLSPGSIALLPSGYIYARFHTKETMCLRWSYSPALDGEEAKVKNMFAALLEAVPGLRATEYMSFFKSMA